MKLHLPLSLRSALLALFVGVSTSGICAYGEEYVKFGEYVNWTSHKQSGCNSDVKSMELDKGSKTFTIPDSTKKVTYDIEMEFNTGFMFQTISTHTSTVDENGKKTCKVTYTSNCNNIGGDGGGKDYTWLCSKNVSYMHGLEDVFIPGVWILAHPEHTNGTPITFTNYGDMVVDSSRQEYALFVPVAYGPVYEVSYKSYYESSPMHRFAKSTYLIGSVGYDLSVSNSKSFTYKNAYTEGDGSFVSGSVDVSFVDVGKVHFVNNKSVGHGLLEGNQINFSIKGANDVQFVGNVGSGAAIVHKYHMTGSAASFKISDVKGTVLFSDNTGSRLISNTSSTFENIDKLVFDNNNARIFATSFSNSNIVFENCGEVVFSNNKKDVNDGLLFASKGGLNASFIDCDKLTITGNQCTEYLFSAGLGSRGTWSFENVSNVEIAHNVATEGVLLNGISVTVNDLIFNGVGGTFNIHHNKAENSLTDEMGYIYAGLCGTDIMAAGVGDGELRADEYHFDSNYVYGCLRYGMVNGVLGAKWFDNVTFNGNTLLSVFEGNNTMVAQIDFSDVGDIEICDNLAVTMGNFGSLVGDDSVISSFSSLSVKNNVIGFLGEEVTICPYITAGILGNTVVTGLDSGDSSLSTVEISSNKIYGYITDYDDSGLKISDVSSIVIKDNFFHAISDVGEHSGGITGRAQFTNIGKVDISDNKSISDSGRAFGGAIGSGMTMIYAANMRFVTSGADEVKIIGNSAVGKEAALGGAIYTSWGTNISNCRNVEIRDNYAQASVISDMSSQAVRDTFTHYIITDWKTLGTGALGGAIFQSSVKVSFETSLRILNNQNFESRRNYVTDGSRYVLQSVALAPADGWSGDDSSSDYGGAYEAYFGASEGGMMAVYDGVFIGGDLNIGVDYKENSTSYEESEQNKGTVLFSGKYAEEDLKTIKSKAGAGVVTQAELDASRTYTVTGSLKIHQGVLEVADGAVLNIERDLQLYRNEAVLKVSRDSTVAFSLDRVNSVGVAYLFNGTIWLDGGMLSNGGSAVGNYGIYVANEGVLKVTSPSTIKSSRIAFGQGGTLALELSSTNSVEPCLTLVANGTLNQLGLGIGVEMHWTSHSVPAYLNLSTSGSLSAGDYILVHLTGDNMNNVGHVEGVDWLTGDYVSGLGDKDSLKWRTNADGTLDLLWTIGSDIVSSVRDATTLTWNGGEGVWAAESGNESHVWTGSVEDLNFYDGDTVVFNSAANVAVEGNVLPAAINVSNAEGTVEIGGSGQIQGAGKLTKTGNGTLVINTRNAFTGGTVLNGGTIEVGDSYALGLGDVELKSGKLDLGGYHLGNKIKATGGTLSGADDYGGMLLVNGELLLEGEVSADGGIGLVAGKLSGGTIKDSVIVADAGELSSTIIGSSSVTAKGGKVTISGDNSHTGGTIIDGAELTVKHAQALGSGAIASSGTSSLIVADGVSLAPSKAISNSGTLTISGKFDGSALEEVAAADVRIDDDGAESAASGFLRTGNYTVTLVEGGTVNSSAATLEYKGKTLSLNGGVGYAAGTVDYSTYLLTGSDSATVSKIAAAAGTSLTGIDMQGGALTVDESTELITATGGSIELTGGIMGGSIGGSTVVTVSGDASISGANTYTGGTNIAGAELTMTHASALGEGTIAVTGTSSLIVGTGVTLVLTDSIMNTDSLSLSGNFNIDALEPSGEVPSVRVDLTGTEGESGFLKTAGYNLQVVQGGLVNDDSAVISHNGKTVELNDAGVAVIEGGINYTQYHIAAGHIAGVTDIVAAATAEGVTLSGISLAEGGTLNADATIEVTADGGTISLTAGTLSGTLKDVQVQASAGDISATFSGEKSALVGSNFVMGSKALQNEGSLALSGSYVADALSSVLTNVDVRVDENGTAGGGSGFLRTGDFTVTLIEGGTVDSSAADVQYNGQLLAMTGGVGFGVGTVDYSTYLLTGSDTATVSKIAAAAGGALSGIDMQGGTLTVDGSTELITATGGNIELTAGVMGGSIGGSTVVTVSGDATISGDNSYTGGTTICGAALTMTHDNALGSGPIAVTGASSLIIADGACLKLTQTITNGDSLTLSGAVNIDALASTGEIPSVRVDLSGAEGESGFLKTGSYQVQVVQGGTVNAESAVISRNGATVSLDEAGVAFIEGRTDYSQYHVGAGHEVDVQSVIAKSSAEGASLQDMSLTGGGTLNVNTSMAVMADGGTINLSSGTLSGSLGGGTVVSVTGIGTISGAHQYEGGTSLTDAALTVDHGESLGTGAIASSGTSSLTVADGAALALRQVITQADDGELTITGGVNADALALERTSSDKRVNLDGEEVAGSVSGFDKDVKYSVQIVEGGKTLGSAAVVKHADYTGPAVLVLGEDGLASTGTIDVDYSDYFLTNGDSANAGDILAEAGKNQTEFDEVHLDDGKLVVDADVTVDSEGGEIELESGNTLSGELKDTTIVVLPGDEASRIEADISGESSVVVSGGSTTISGNSSFEGGTSVSDEGELIVENASALGNGDVDVASSIIDLTAAEGVKNTVSLSGTSTVRGADNARYFELMKGSVTSFEGGFVLDEGKTLAVRNARAATFALRSLRSGEVTLYKGALTLAGGTLSLDSMLKVEGKVTFMAGRRTLVDISGWEGAGEGTTLADFGTDNEGYTKGCLTLSGIAGRYELLFDEATGLLTLGLIPEDEKPVISPEDLPEPEKLPELTSNQKAVYEALSDMIEDGDLEGELRDIVQSTLESGDAEAITAMLEQLSGAEYAVVMGSQIDGNTAHLSYLRRMAGSGWELVGNSYTRAYVEMYTNDSNVNGDAHGRGYDRTEMGGQFALEFIGCKHMSSGIAVAAGRTRLQADGALRVHSENVYADAYTMYRSDNGYNALFSAGVGIHEHDLARNVSGHRTKANADGLSFNFMHESSVDMKINETNKVQLFAAVESSWNDIESFREKGAGSASLECDDQQAWATDITLGARYIHRFVAFHYGPAASLTLEAGVIASVGDISSDADMHFAGVDDKEFSVRSAKRNRWGYNVGASFHLPMSPFSAVQLGGEATLRGDSCDWNVNAGVQIAF